MSRERIAQTITLFALLVILYVRFVEGIAFMEVIEAYLLSKGLGV